MEKFYEKTIYIFINHRIQSDVSNKLGVIDWYGLEMVGQGYLFTEHDTGQRQQKNSLAFKLMNVLNGTHNETSHFFFTFCTTS